MKQTSAEQDLEESQHLWDRHRGSLGGDLEGVGREEVEEGEPRENSVRQDMKKFSKSTMLFQGQQHPVL